MESLHSSTSLPLPLFLLYLLSNPPSFFYSFQPWPPLFPLLHLLSNPPFPPSFISFPTLLLLGFLLSYIGLEQELLKEREQVSLLQADFDYNFSLLSSRDQELSHYEAAFVELQRVINSLMADNSELKVCTYSVWCRLVVKATTECLPALRCELMFRDSYREGAGTSPQKKKKRFVQVQLHPSLQTVSKLIGHKVGMGSEQNFGMHSAP